MFQTNETCEALKECYVISNILNRNLVSGCHLLKKLINLQEFEQCFNEYIGQTKRQFGTRSKEHQKAVFFVKKENSALSERNCLTNYTIGRYNCKIITTYRCYHQRLCLEAWHMNSAHAPLNRDDGGLLPDAYLHLVKKKVANQ